jgi:hypothetical protein
MKPAEERTLAGIRAELSRVIRYDDESIVNRVWVMQRYDCGCFPGLARARKATVETAWHEAGHAVAALAVGARFSSASIRHACGQEGRVHGVRGATDLAFVIDAAGQIAERLRTWTLLERDDELRAWLPTWKRDGGDARRFRRAAAPGLRPGVRAPAPRPASGSRRPRRHLARSAAGRPHGRRPRRSARRAGPRSARRCPERLARR